MFILLTNAFDFGVIFKNITTKWYYYLALFVFFICLVLFFAIKKQPKRNNLTKTQRLCYTSILTAICVVANVFDIKVSDAFQISLVATVGLISGYLMGGGYAFVVCFLGDFIGGIISPHGAYNPIIGIGSSLWGLIPALIFSYFRGNTYLKTIISFIICSILISGLINTYGIYLMYGSGKTFGYYFALYPMKLVVALVNLVLSLAILRLLKKSRLNSKFLLD